MASLGELLKDIRENLALLPQEVFRKTNIDISTLSRIENGKRFPTRTQIQELAELYECDQHLLMVHWLSEKVYVEIKDEQENLEAINVVKEKLIYGNSKTLLNGIKNDRIELESRRYIGNKTKLNKWIIENIVKETVNCNSFLDIFAGTGTVSKAASKHFTKFILNDILPSNNIIYRAFFKDELWDFEKISEVQKKYNELNPHELDENYFSLNFGGKFFDYLNSKLIGFIREDIEEKKGTYLNDKEYAILLASLIYSIDRIANTVGHFDAYIKKPIQYKPLFFKIINPAPISDLEIFQEDANILARNITSDIAYIDPPYNSRQYSRFYHVYDNLIKWEKPNLFGVALKPAPEYMSVYCRKGAQEAFRDLVNSLRVRYIAVSYNNTFNSKSNSSENKIRLENIVDILQRLGPTKEFQASHKFFNTGKTEFEDHKEFLFITKVND